MGDKGVTLSAGDYIVQIDPARGGSVSRFAFRGEDLLRPSQPGTILDTACFPLVPFSNRIANGRFTADGREVTLAPNMPGTHHPHPLHGFGWLAQWRVMVQDGVSAVLEHDYAGGNEWPWAYKALQSFVLREDSLTVALSLTNLGETPMPAGLGLHPYFPREDAVYRGLHKGEWQTGDDGLPLDLAEKPAPADWWDGQPVGSRAVDTVYTGRAGALSVSWPGRGITLDIAPSDNLGFTVVYTPPGKDYFCIEPVTHRTDAVNDPGAKMDWLAPSASMVADVTFRAKAAGV